jgi:hypothetical protein
VNNYNNDKNKLISLLSKKDEDIKEKVEKQKILNEDINKQLNENKKIKQNILLIQNKCKNLLNSKNLLEDKVIKQENKVNELTKSINEIKKIVNEKENEINQDKIYINNLKEIISDLNKEYNESEINNKIIKNGNNNYDYNKEITSLKLELNHLKNGGTINNNIDIFNYKIKKSKNKRYNSIKNHNSLLIKDNSVKKKNVIPKIINYQKYKLINNNKIKTNSKSKNKSLPNVEEHKRKYIEKKLFKMNGMAKNNIKSQIIKPYDNFNMPIIESRNYNNRSTHKIYEKHLNNSIKEEYEKQKIDEVKVLLDKIVSDFDV